MIVLTVLGTVYSFGITKVHSVALGVIKWEEVELVIRDEVKETWRLECWINA